MAGVESDEPSSTTTNSQSAKVWFSTDSIESARYCSRLKTGRMTETVGSAMAAPVVNRRSAARIPRELRRTLPIVSGQLSSAPLGRGDRDTDSRATADDGRG